MQIESLRVFCDIARFRSFSQAAQANFMSQSAASQIVHQLEERLKVQLINRSTRPLQLTELGKRYYEGCKGLIEQYAELEASIRQAQTQLAASVQVAAIYSVGLGDMGQYVERFQAQHPQAQIRIDYLHPDRVYEQVLDGTADFGLVSFPHRSRELTTLPWRDEEMVLACSSTHPLAQHSLINPEQLAGEKYIGFDKHLVIRKEVDRFLREHGATVEVAMEFDNIENIKQAIDEAAGVALLPEPTLRREVQAGTLAAVRLQGCRFVRPLGIIQRRQHKLNATALAFRDLLRQADRTASPDGPETGTSANGRETQPHANGSPRSRNGSHRSTKKAE
jgi:DNA-binding transcriptional LysR family regulator